MIPVTENTVIEPGDRLFYELGSWSWTKTVKMTKEENIQKSFLPDQYHYKTIYGPWVGSGTFQEIEDPVKFTSYKCWPKSRDTENHNFHIIKANERT